VLVAGVVFAVVGLGAIGWVWWVRHGGGRIQGEVVDSGALWSAGGGMRVSTGLRYWRPVVQFTPAGGSPLEFRSPFGTFIRYEQGQQVPVCYRASRPRFAVIDTFSQAWLVPVGFLVVGVVTLAVTLLQ